jgi:hypothetical protein
MIIINKPEELLDVQCYRCKVIMKAHPMTNMNSEYFTNWEMHHPQPLQTKDVCIHESDYAISQDCLHPIVSLDCRKCGEFYK